MLRDPDACGAGRAINADGLTAYMHTGAYRVPTPVLTTSVMDDIALVAEVVGVGELAVSDSRSSVPSFDELARIASDARVRTQPTPTRPHVHMHTWTHTWTHTCTVPPSCRCIPRRTCVRMTSPSVCLFVQVASLLSGKAGVVHVHVGKGAARLAPLFAVVDNTDIPITQFHLTHIGSRGPELLEEALVRAPCVWACARVEISGDSHPPLAPPSSQTWMGRGGTVDFTADAAGETATAATLTAWRAAGQPLSQVTISSDAYGSLPTLDDDGTVIGYGVAKPDALLQTVQSLVDTYGWPLEEALALVTSHPARVYALAAKGRIAAGADGDLLVLDRALAPQYVFARGRAVKTLDWIKKGMFEP
jgi:beta-aspartyl-dipeptidase (metallo-type)